MRARLPALMVLSLLPGCENVLGVDFSSYKGPGGSTGGACSPIGTNSCGNGKGCVCDGAKFTCQAVTGTTTQYDVCKAVADCVAGSTCVAFPTNLANHCSAYCVTSATCDAGHSCRPLTNAPKLSTGETVGICGPLENPCDPTAAQSSCGAGQRCSLLDSDYTVCLAQEDTRSVGAACTLDTQCIEGTACLGNQTSGTHCLQACFVDTPNCPGTQTCTGFTTKVVLGAQEVGVCL